MCGSGLLNGARGCGSSAARSAFAWPSATDSSLARRDLKALRTRDVTLFTSSTGAFVTVSTASTADDTESVISFTSSRI